MRHDRYTVIKTNDCIVIEGAISIPEMSALLCAWGDGAAPRDWIFDALLAEALRASVVTGPMSACRSWRERLGIAPEGPPRPERRAGRGNPKVVPENGAKARYRLVNDPYAGIQCLTCGMTSYNANDVRHRFCGNCNTFLEG
jgi:choline dehydrogenase-like flavoprotein